MAWMPPPTQEGQRGRSLSDPVLIYTLLRGSYGISPSVSYQKGECDGTEKVGWGQAG